MPHQQVRKANRLEGFDYTAPGYYFVTFCTAEKRCTLGCVIPGDGIRSSVMELNRRGSLVEQTTREIPAHYPGIRVDHFTVMPNHVHLILVLPEADHNPSISRIVQQLKRVTSMKAGEHLWQAHFHDHVIRGERDYQAVWQYVDSNAEKWCSDCYYTT